MQRNITIILSVLLLALVMPVTSSAKSLSDAEISKEILAEHNKAIIEAFLKNELREVNEKVTMHLLKDHPSLTFFIKQVDRGPLKSLIFLEEWVNKLREAQQNIDKFPVSMVFSAEEKKKIMGLKPAADKIVSYGIPLIKRDFYRVMAASKEVADKKGKHPMELMPDPAFRNAVYRQCETTAEALDREMGELSEGELICMRLGWVLEQVTVTSLWLKINDNDLPLEKDYMVYRKKRSEYFQNRLKKIYADQTGTKRP
jgi:hypothetical protein